MLFPKAVKRRLVEEHDEFREAFNKVLELMSRVVEQRGNVRDVNTPIYYRRDPSECLGLAKNKLLRAGSILSSIDQSDPDTEKIKDLLEELIDSQNYSAFLAALCVVILDEEAANFELVDSQFREELDQ